VTEFNNADPYVPRRLARRRHRKVRAVLVGAVGLMLVAALVAGTYVFNLARTFNDKTQEISSAFPDEANRPVKDPEDGSLNILLMGADFGGSNQVPASLIAGGATGQRSDTLMLLHVPEDRSGLYVMSIMRDTWTEIPGHGEHKINAALAFGGVPLVVETIEGLLDTKVDHVAMVDFQGFRDLTTALGGVEVHNEIPFTADDTDYFYPVGDITLEGDYALRFVRERKSFADGDYQRVRNQQLFLQAVMDKFLTAETLTNPATIYEVIDKVSPYLSLDASLDAGTAAGLGLQLKDIRSSDVELFTLPTAGTGTSADGQSIVLKDEAAIAEVGAALQSDTLAEYLDRTASETSADSSTGSPGAAGGPGPSNPIH
jgi:polyisoprenyl-teichoic acid--peptidoglycan teichoic acid transferase